MACKAGCGEAPKASGAIARPRQTGRVRDNAHQDIFCLPTQMAILSRRRVVAGLGSVGTREEARTAGAAR